MQATDMILGLLIMLLVGWTVMLAVQQQALSLDMQALEARQNAQGIQISPEACNPVQGKSIVRATDITEREYFTTVGFNPDQNQIYLCFYQ
jgi:hypothetical protein